MLKFMLKVVWIDWNFILEKFYMA